MDETTRLILVRLQATKPVLDAIRGRANFVHHSKRQCDSLKSMLARFRGNEEERAGLVRAICAVQFADDHEMELISELGSNQVPKLKKLQDYTAIIGYGAERFWN